MESYFLFIGHRGTRIKYDENTIDAFNIAINHGANYIELDIRRLNDGNLIVFHDASLERTTNGSGLIKDYNYSEFKNFNTVLQKSKIPLLIDVLEEFKNKTGFMIELKEELLWKSAIDVILDKKIVKETIISARNLSMLNLIKKQLPNIQICYNITKGEDLSLEDFLNISIKSEKLIDLDYISLKSSLINKKFINNCHNNNLLALAWNFMEYEDPVKKMKYLIDLGIDGILFDDYRNINRVKDYIASL